MELNSSSTNESNSGKSYANLISSLNIVYPLPVCLFGTVGNLFILIVYTKSKSLRRLTTSFYIRLQAVSDTLMIYLGVLRYFLLGVANLSLKDSSTFMCKSLNYAIFVANFVSAWLLVMSSIDRLIFICSYKRLKALTRRSVQVAVALSILAIGFLLFLAQPLAYDLRSSSSSSKLATCSESELIWRQALNVIETISTVIVPFVLLTITSVLLINLVKQSKKKFKYKPSITSVGTVVDERRTSSSQAAANQVQRRPSKPKSTSNFSSTIIILNVCFLLFNLPASIVNLIRSLGNLASTEIILAQTFTTIIRYSYTSLAFFAHLGSNRIFRATFINFILRRKLVDT